MKNSLLKLLSNCKTLFVGLLLCFMSLAALGQGYNWSLRNPQLTPHSFISIMMKDTANGVAVNSRLQHCARTINGGKYWSSASYSDKDSGPLAWCRVGKKHTYIVEANEYKLYKIANDGSPQTTANLPYAFFAISFGDSLHGYGLTYSTGLDVYKTLDGGQTWALASSLPTDFNTLALGARTNTEVWAISNNKIWKSTNSAATWDSVNLNFYGYRLGYVNWMNSNRGFISYDSGRYWKTNNGGLTGQGGRIAASGNYIEDMQFLNNNLGYARSYNQLFKTINGGTTWTQINSPWTEGFGSFCLLSADALWASFSGAIAKSTDGGLTWNMQTKGYISDLGSIEFQSKNRLWARGQNVILRSESKGKTWEKVNPGPVQFYRSLQFVRPDMGYIHSWDKILKTTNGGQTWTEIVPNGLTSSSSADFMHFIHPDTGLCLASGVVHRTVNGGKDWTLIGSPQSFQKVIFHDRANWVGFAQGSNFEFKAYKTNNAGQTWEENVAITEGGWAETMQFISPDKGWMIYRVSNTINAPSYNGMYSTSDGGLHWSRIHSGDFYNGGAMQIEFANENKGYFTFGKYIYETQNGGLEWTKTDSTGNSTSCTDFALVNEKPAIIVGYGGAIYTSNEWTGKTDYVVSGEIRRNENGDCLPNSNELRLPNRMLIGEPGPYFASSDSAGRFYMDVDTGAYSISQAIYSPTPVALESQFCPAANAPVQVNVNGLLDTLEGSNFLNNTQLCPVLNITQSHRVIRPCRRSSLLVTIQNLGNIASDSEYVHIKFAPQLYLLSASGAFNYVASDSTYRFKIKPLQPFESLDISIVDSVACNPSGLTGQFLCVKATIPNVPACLLQSPNWDGADLEVASRCVANQTKFTIHNKGASMPSAAQYQIFINGVLVYQAPFQLAANGSMTVTLPANAPTGFVRLVVPQSANHPLSTFASAEANCATGLSSNGMFPPSDQSPLVDIECVTVTNAVDPNDKTVYPTGWGEAGNVEPETEFKYTIRFQNTGTDTAFKVVLVDTLDAALDIASLQIGAASHPSECRVSGKGQPVMSWSFNNILLPDSGANQLASNGFVSFSIRPKLGLPLGTRLENFADIYFDFNDPVRTNTTLNTLWRPTLVEGVLDTVFTVTANKAWFSQKDLSLFPNPSKGKLELNSPEAGWITLYSTNGEAVLKTHIEAGHNAFNFAQLPKGLYLAQLQFADGQVSKKVILE